jgi:hypothetical protein
MAHLPLLSFRGVSRVLGTVGVASVAVALVRRVLRPSPSRPARRPAPVASLRAVPNSLRDGHLGATEKTFDWVRAGRA